MMKINIHGLAILLLCNSCSDRAVPTSAGLKSESVVMHHYMGLPPDMRLSLVRDVKKGSAEAAYQLMIFSHTQMQCAEAAFYWGTKARALGHPQVTQDWLDSIERSIYDSAAPGNGKTYESLEEALKDLEAKGAAKSGK